MQSLRLDAGGYVNDVLEALIKRTETRNEEKVRKAIFA